MKHIENLIFYKNVVFWQLYTTQNFLKDENQLKLWVSYDDS